MTVRFAGRLKALMQSTNPDPAFVAVAADIWDILRRYQRCRHLVLTDRERRVGWTVSRRVGGTAALHVMFRIRQGDDPPVIYAVDFRITRA